MTIPEQVWKERARTVLKDELRRRGVSYKELARLLMELGLKRQTDLSIANKLARGGFSAVFLIQCLTAIGCRQIKLRFDDDD
ncbi:MAG: DUF6471 domain-containing protein [Vitreimonas sp.]